MTSETAGMVIGFALTVLILSYLILDDNPLFRLGAHLLIGIVSGFLLAVIVRAVLWDQFLVPLVSNLINPLSILSIALMMILLVLLAARQLVGGSAWGNLPMAYLVGVGAAVVVGGAITGTLIPQSVAAAAPSLFPTANNSLDYSTMIENWFVLAGTVFSLAYFHFGAKPRGGAAPEQPAIVKPFARIGAVYVSITLGALYAGALLSAMVILVERVYFLIDVLLRLPGVGS